MKKLLIITSLVAVSMLMAKPAHKGGGKHINKGSINSSLKGANSVVKPNKYKKYDKKYDKNFNKSRDRLERDVTKQVIKAVL